MSNTVALTRAFGSLVSTKNLTTSDSFTLGNKTFIIKGTITTIGDIHLGTDETSTLANIISAINGSGSSGTDYYTATVPPTDVYAALQSAHVVRFYGAFPGAWGNNIIITEGTDGGTAFAVTTFTNGAGAIGTSVGWVQSLIANTECNAEILTELHQLTQAAD